MSNLPIKFQTNNLEIRLIREEDKAFMLELVNTEGWKKFIADMNILNEDKAALYIQRINEAPNTYYWTVICEKTKIGIITFLKRPSLEYYDLGFAFLPKYTGKGYASEASKAFLKSIEGAKVFEKIQAITSPENIASIKLLEKIGFEPESKIEEQSESSLVYFLKN